MDRWVAYHGKTSDEHQSHVDDLSPKHFRMISLSVSGDPDDARYSAVWVHRPGSKWRAFHGKSADEYQGIVDRWKKDDFHPVLIAATGSGSDAIYAGVFEDGHIGTWKARHGIHLSELQAEHRSARKENQIPVCVVVYGEGDDRRYAAIWHPNTQKYRWLTHEQDGAGAYQTWFDAVTQIPMRPAFVALSDDQRYASVFRDDSMGPWHAVHDLSSDQYQSEFEAQKKKDRLPICVQAGGSGSDTRYAAIFATRDQPEERKWTVTGAPNAALAELDHRMKQVMQDKGVRAASLTVGKNGTLVLSRGYTWAEPDYRITQPDDVFRLASVSKMFTSAAIYELLQAHAVSASAKVFHLLGLTPLAGQTPDPRLGDITVQHLIDHTGGWDATLAGFDPVFSSRKIAHALGLHDHPTKRQMAQYMVGQELQFTPGHPHLKDDEGNDRDPYSNFGYVMLGLVIEHVSGVAHYVDYVKQATCAPLDIHDVHLAATRMSGMRSDEVRAECPSVSVTALDPDSDKLLPTAYGGFVLDTMDSGGGLLASTRALCRFVHHYAAWGAALRSPGAARTGSEDGTRSRVGSRSNGYDYAFVFDTREDLEDEVDRKGTEYIDKFGNDLEALLDTLP